MKNIKYMILAICMCIVNMHLAGQSSPKKIGDEVIKKYESPHPYSGIRSANNKELDYKKVWSQEIRFADASYIAVHFSKVQLSIGDFIVVRSPDGERMWKYSNLFVENDSPGLWSVHIYGEVAIVEIYSKNINGSFGYQIDKIARGYPVSIMKNNDDDEAICGADDTVEAVCLSSTEPQVYNRSRAIARLLINGTSACTGWLIGSEGHIMTNNHCVKNASDANNVTVEFMAEGSTCATNCQSWFACPGTIEATSTTLIQTHVNLDYSLLELPTNVSGTYGFLQLRNIGPILNERIYIPQHPKAWGKRIALLSDSDPGGFPLVNSLIEPPCIGGATNEVGYSADTQGGSSGSPVLSYDDHLVVALHHCANCPNRGVPIDAIINDLGSNLPIEAVLSSCPTDLTLTGIETNSITHQAANTITSTQTITPTADVEYFTGNQITLNTGFFAQDGAVFLAEINPCSNVNKSANESIAQPQEPYEYEVLQQTNSRLNTTETLTSLTVAPNPFYSTTTLSFQLKENTIADLSIYDINGRTIKQLFTGNLKKGSHEFVWTVKDIPPGVYLARLVHGDQLETIRIVLSK